MTIFKLIAIAVQHNLYVIKLTNINHRKI